MEEFIRILKNRLPNFLLDDYFFYQSVEKNVLEIFNMVNFFSDFNRIESSQILFESNCWLGMLRIKSIPI